VRSFDPDVAQSRDEIDALPSRDVRDDLRSVPSTA